MCSSRIQKESPSAPVFSPDVGITEGGNQLLKDFSMVMVNYGLMGLL